MKKWRRWLFGGFILCFVIGKHRFGAVESGGYKQQILGRKPNDFGARGWQSSSYRCLYCKEHLEYSLVFGYNNHQVYVRHFGQLGTDTYIRHFSALSSLICVFEQKYSCRFFTKSSGSSHLCHSSIPSLEHFSSASSALFLKSFPSKIQFLHLDVSLSKAIKSHCLKYFTAVSLCH